MGSQVATFEERRRASFDGLLEPVDVFSIGGESEEEIQHVRTLWGVLAATSFVTVGDAASLWPNVIIEWAAGTELPPNEAFAPTECARLPQLDG